MTGSANFQRFLSNAEHNGKPRFDRRDDPGGHLRRGMPVVGTHGTAQALVAAAGGRRLRSGRRPGHLRMTLYGQALRLERDGMPSQPDLPRPYWSGLSRRWAVIS